VSFSLAISNVIEPLRPVSRLLYSPDHVPTRRADEPLSEITGTGVRFHAHAVRAVNATTVAALMYLIR
jgi:hypothetical protein